MFTFFALVAADIAFAANWQFVMTGDTPRYGGINVYFDTESVAKNGDTLIFYVRNVFDNPGPDAKTIVFKEEVNMVTRQYRYLEVVGYDANGVEMNRMVIMPWRPLVPDSPGQTLVDKVLPYAKQKTNENMLQGPLRVDYEYQSGPYVRRLRGVVNDPPGLWQALLPLQPPPGARGGYGLIGDDYLLDKESGFGLRQLGAVARRHITAESIYVVQPAGFSDIGVQEGVFTSVDSMNDTTLGWVFFDLRPKFEADLKKRLNLNP